MARSPYEGMYGTTYGVTPFVQGHGVPYDEAPFATLHGVPHGTKPASLYGDRVSPAKGV